MSNIRATVNIGGPALQAKVTPSQNFLVTNDLFIRGLPFSSNSATMIYTGTPITQQISFTHHLIAEIIQNTSYIKLSDLFPTTSRVAVKISSLTTGASNIILSMSYRV